MEKKEERFEVMNAGNHALGVFLVIDLMNSARTAVFLYQMCEGSFKQVLIITAVHIDGYFEHLDNTNFHVAKEEGHELKVRNEMTRHRPAQVVQESQLEQDLQRAGQQDDSGTLAFDAEYSRRLEEHNKHINELGTAVNSHASDPELRSIVNNVTAHYDEVFRMKGNAAKADVFHVLSGMWKPPSERCFMWIGGFRPSELLKLLVNQLEPLTEQQLLGIYNLQQSSQRSEDVLSQGMEALQQSLAETLANGSNYMGQMAMAMGKLGTLEGFLRQAHNLRQQTLQHMHRILTTRQSARALLAISEYFSRLRALSLFGLPDHESNKYDMHRNILLKLEYATLIHWPVYEMHLIYYM
ncbi:TGACG-sequence-specific DNA-binding protein TGA-2.1-like [Solanum dulcamara]|uniref:TGACG-sequence-specific DNA-binding protein TGA-2.1-like n=1 Tax=Solanum dulcamara TaxID=45834 RepID=UPI002485260E|nr:TGACG-sequence-specific DNA-binding protein TGA-2.1-like [Solanum dulcamara]